VPSCRKGFVILMNEDVNVNLAGSRVSWKKNYISALQTIEIRCLGMAEGEGHNLP
jgi:hypothetical protein